jgi:hypothetical protein
MSANDEPTHTAYIKHQKTGRLIDSGSARINGDGTTNGYHRIELHSTPVGGFSGVIHLFPVGVKPPVATPQPQRPSAPQQPPPDDGEQF